MISVCNTTDSNQNCTDIFQINPLPYGYLWDYDPEGVGNPINCGDTQFTLRSYGSSLATPICTGSLVASYKFISSNVVYNIITAAFYCHCVVTLIEIVGTILWATHKDWKDQKGQAIAMEGLGGFYAIYLYYKTKELVKNPVHHPGVFVLVTLTDALNGVVAPIASMIGCSVTDLFVGHFSYNLTIDYTLSLHYLVIVKSIKLAGVILHFVYARCTSKNMYEDNKSNSDFDSSQ